MTNEQILTEIREANMTYLMLAQSLIRQDKAEALFRLGMSEESADLIGAPASDGRVSPQRLGRLCQHGPSGGAASSSFESQRPDDASPHHHP